MIAIIKYNAGNISSVQNALYRLGQDSLLTDDPNEILSADKVIFPGVGEASSAMEYLKTRNLDQVLREVKQPMLGICLGLQLMCMSSDEGNTQGLGMFDTRVRKFPARDKVPHMGWNNFSELSGELFKNIKKDDDVYFVHSYYAEVNEQTIAICNYIQPFAAALHQNNFYATQFHPEKSAAVGEQILKNFLAI